VLLQSFSRIQPARMLLIISGQGHEPILSFQRMFNFTTDKIESDGEYIFSFEKKKFFIPQYFSLPKSIDFFLIFLSLHGKIRNPICPIGVRPNPPG
jgi:hypothetical protein